jgi:16S rRNA (guanine527-N7)-methyltransferase
MSNPLRPLLIDGLNRLGLATDSADALLAYLGLLARWNQTYNLTAIRDPQEMLVKHLLDSLSLMPHLHGHSLADIGTGAGLPGIPLAIMRADLQVALVESNGKKARFMRHALRELGLSNARVIESRAEDVAETGAFDCLSSRAFGTLAEFIRVAGHLLAPDGQMLAMKGARPSAEEAVLPQGWVVATVHALAVPGLDAERHLVVLERRSPD